MHRHRTSQHSGCMHGGDLCGCHDPIFRDLYKLVTLVAGSHKMDILNVIQASTTIAIWHDLGLVSASGGFARLHTSGKVLSDWHVAPIYSGTAATLLRYQRVLTACLHPDDHAC